jgi:hypothetical protein
VVIGSGTYIANTLTPIASYALAAGTLGTNRSALFRATGHILNNSTLGRGYRLQVTLGGFTLYEASTSAAFLGNNAVRRPFWLDVEVSNQGATNKQRASGILNIGANSGTTPVIGIGSLDVTSPIVTPFVGPIGGTTVDTTVPQTLLIQWSWNAQHASLVLTVEQIRMLLLG